MSSLKIIAIIIALFVTNNQINGQTVDEEPGAPKSTEVSFITTIRCNQLMTKSIRNCKDQHLPLYIILSMTGNRDGLCCAYSKYRDCISDLKTGLKELMDKENCPRSDTYDAVIFYAENVVGFTIRPRCVDQGSSRWCLRANQIGDN